MPSKYREVFVMVKEKKLEVVDEHQQKQSKKNVKIYFLWTGRILVWSFLLAFLLWLWLKPEIVYRLTENVKQIFLSDENLDKTNPSISQLQKEINELRISFLNLGANQNRLAAKIPNEDVIQNLDSNYNKLVNEKADTSVVMGLITRLDKIEQRVDKLAKISDQGALILTSVMFIKDSAEKGQSFAYEAELLKMLSEGNETITLPVQTILSFSEKNLFSTVSLQQQFEDIFRTIVKLEKNKNLKEKSWKEIFNQKLNEYVQVRRTDVDDKNSENSEENILENILSAVRQDNLSLAVDILTQPNNQYLLQYSDLNQWLIRAKDNVAFYKAISEISHQALALMKLNYVKQDVVTE